MCCVTNLALSNLHSGDEFRFAKFDSGGVVKKLWGKALVILGAKT